MCAEVRSFMNASILDLRRNMKSVLAAINRNERISLTYRGKKKAMIVPCGKGMSAMPASRHPAFGMWSEREGMDDVAAFTRSLRKGRSF